MPVEHLVVRDRELIIDPHRDSGMDQVDGRRVVPVRVITPVLALVENGFHIHPAPLRYSSARRMVVDVSQYACTRTAERAASIASAISSAQLSGPGVKHAETLAGTGPCAAPAGTAAQSSARESNFEIRDINCEPVRTNGTRAPSTEQAHSASNSSSVTGHLSATGKGSCPSIVSGNCLMAWR